VRVLCPGVDPASVESTAEALRLIEHAGTDALGFLQCFHLHRASAAVRAVARGPALAGVAAQLLGAPRVRLFQDAGAAGWLGAAEGGPLALHARAVAALPPHFDSRSSPLPLTSAPSRCLPRAPQCS
jgi:hypothetical protein